jgi:hypothetical protein
MKRWIKFYSTVGSHEFVDHIDNISDLFELFGLGLSRFYPKRVACTIFLNTFNLYRISTGRLYKRLIKGGLRLRISTLELDVNLQFVPYSARFVRDENAWTAFHLLSSLNMHYQRNCITEIPKLSKVSGNYVLSVKQIHSLYQPNTSNYAMLRLMHIYLGSIYNPSTAIRRLYREVGYYISARKSSVRTVPPLVSICLCTLVCSRDRSASYFLKHFRIHKNGIHSQILSTIANLNENEGNFYSACVYHQGYFIFV